MKVFTKNYLNRDWSALIFYFLKFGEIRLLVIFLIIFSSGTLSGQDSPIINPLLLQGIEQEDFTFLDAAGYSIVVHTKRKAFSPKTVKKLKRKFDIPKSLSGIESPNYTTPNLVFEDQTSVGDVTSFSKKVIYAAGDKVTKVISMSTPIARDQDLENRLFAMIIDNSIPKEIMNNWIVDSIRFVDRHIKLGSACQWQNVGSIQCPYNGQMDWSVFQNRERAEEYIRHRMTLTSKKKMSDFKSNDTIPVAFEEQEVEAQRRILKLKVPKIVLEGSNELTIYYVVAEVAGVYVACIMSHYANDTNAPGLPPLLSEVMSLKQ